jgi:hypothetical protein
VQTDLRLRAYDSADPDIRFDVHAVGADGRTSTLVTIIRMIWYPWAVEGLASWRRCAAKHNRPPEIRAALDRSLGHLVVGLSTEALADLLRSSKPVYVAAESYYGLGQVP